MFCSNFSIAFSSMSKQRISSAPVAARMPSAWNSDCEPEPIIAWTLESGRASLRATIPEAAAVRSAVSTVISARKVG